MFVRETGGSCDGCGCLVRGRWRVCARVWSSCRHSHHWLQWRTGHSRSPAGHLQALVHHGESGSCTAAPHCALCACLWPNSVLVLCHSVAFHHSWLRLTHAPRCPMHAQFPPHPITGVPCHCRPQSRSSATLACLARLCCTCLGHATERYK